MKTQQKNARRAIKKVLQEAPLSAARKKLIRLFDDLDSMEQVEVFAQLARRLADSLEEDRIDHQLMDKRRHEEALGRPWSEVRKELGIGKTRRKKSSQ